MAATKKIIILLLFILLFSSVIYYKRKYIALYNNNLTHNHFLKGNDMHLNHKQLPYMSGTVFPLFKLVKNPSSLYQPVLVGSISIDSLNKYKTDCIGTYLDYKIIPIKINDTTLITRLYKIKPNLRLVNKNDHKQVKISSFFDDNYYIIANDFLIQ